MHAKTPEELIRLATLELSDAGRFHAWRGQSNAAWEPLPGIYSYRRLRVQGYSDDEITEELVTRYEGDIFCEANGLGFYGEAGGNRLSLMIQLQRYGAATRLLDITSNPLVSLWFASAPGNTPGAVFCYSVDMRCHALPEKVPTWDGIVSAEHAGKPVIFTPQRINERIKAQLGMFLVTSLWGNLAEGSAYTDDNSESDISRFDKGRSPRLPAELHGHR